MKELCFIYDWVLVLNKRFHFHGINRGAEENEQENEIKNSERAFVIFIYDRRA